MPPPSPLLPMLAAMLGITTFAVMDGMMKVATLALGAYGAMFWRNLAGSLIMLPIWLRRGNGWPSPALMKLHLKRSAVVAVLAVLFFYGLARTPIGEAMALTFISPLIALYLASWMLGETVSRRAVIGSVIGLGGVAVIALGKFSGDYTADSIQGLVAILVSAALYAWNLVLQREQAQLACPEEIAFFQTLMVFCLLGIGAWWFAPPPALGDWWMLIGSAVLSLVSLILLSWAYSRAEAQVLVPLEYTAFIWAALFGWLVFSEEVTWRTLIGVTLIVAGCLLASRRNEPHLEPV
ncbi:DMT family transporter [Novosphingobium sp. Chol11]|uniref:DMT family transporter n=1 Tax=Novosphingobium sp. Chol11 TaxID=1385763 RepID=UPI0025F14F0F|nr:DMT family transporter [Novosphingobium sp. Chol11]